MELFNDIKGGGDELGWGLLVFIVIDGILWFFIYV